MSTRLFGIRDWTFQYSHSLGRNEYAGTGFRYAVDLGEAPGDILYVLNRSYLTRREGIRVSVVTLDEKFLFEFGKFGDRDGEFTWPTAIVLDREEKVYVADEWLNRISIFNKDGEFLRKWGTAGAGPGELNRPAGMALAPDGTLFVTDSRSHRIQKFTVEGKYLGQFGGFGVGPGQLNMPWGIALSGDGLVYVADWRNDRVQVFTSEGKWQASFGRSGDGVGEFNRPNSVALDQDGILYVTDWLNNRVQILNQEGRVIAILEGHSELSRWAKDKLTSNPEMVRQRAIAMAGDPSFERKFRHPSAVKVDGQNRILIFDQLSSRIQVYMKRKTPVLV